ncbi:tRNA (5-methylaminomethyl-2-thiouridine)(34)-methyltransferase MnmD [Fulvivirga sp. 29W222]|uniref:tRNA (5-methylaminomethyl-2-thiouridine)(34)-methyltransferase MnmD n=1 Tax=Fulvivirga marina TaxID=2494733 RepID=A0A937KCH2_9BACT|nr:tRNA (5-methylaminomethyl-2-thiouridine)(34)-methyltransferase MnmD [Fulvivirga marina]MBL6444965.1 tRNA (5-methylaminomethyl-2-thiouridine)(34)-methyltransferase MnmD [Fulvivirga marina]
MTKEAGNNEEKIKLITTDDGSHSLYVPNLNETYHSFHGAVQESRHVFIEMGLAHQKSRGLKNIKIFEVGLGTGLNALLTAEFAEKHQIPVHFTSIEAFPVDFELIKQLNYTSYLDLPKAKSWFEKIHTSQWNEDIVISPFFTLNKIQTKLEDYVAQGSTFDIIYFDAFAPNKQAELWDITILSDISNSMKHGGIFVTYCAKGQLKRDLQSLHLNVETLPGPPGKKEMVRASK